MISIQFTLFFYIWSIVIAIINIVTIVFVSADSFRRIVAENGFSVVIRPSLAEAHTTGSDLSQVELSFAKDATILKLLVRLGSQDWLSFI